MAPDTHSTIEALAAIAKSMEEQSARTQQSIDDLITKTQQTFLEFNTRTQAVETLVQRLADENAKTAGNVERLTTTVTQLRGVMQELRSGDRRPDKQPIAEIPHQQNMPPLLPSPPGASTYHSGGSNQAAPPSETHYQQVRTPCIDVVLFTGDDVEAWLFQIERFFEHNQIPLDQRLTMATFYMNGEPLRWYQWLYSTHQVTDWLEFVQDIKARFGPSAYWDPEVALNKLHQTTSVASYIAEFESLSLKTPDLNPRNLLKRFMAVLKDEVHREMVLMRPTNLRVAMGMARIAEQKLNETRNWVTRPTFSRTSVTPPSNQGADQRAIKAPGARGTTNLPVRRLSITDMAARREKGLCFNCDEKFVPGYQCKPRFQCLVLEEDVFEEEPLEPSYEEVVVIGDQEQIEADVPSISFHALQGKPVPQTLRIEGMLKGARVVVLIDTGSTHNFLQGRIARNAGIPVEKAKHLNVTVGNGDALSCEGQCKNVELCFGNNSFHVDFYLPPIYGADAVLGAQWLAELGPILFDYKALRMSFEHVGKTVELNGLQQQASFMQISLGQFKRMTKVDSVASYYQLIASERFDTQQSATLPAIPDELTSPQKLTLQQMLLKYTTVFDKPRGLPPPRVVDHHIPLLPGVAPVNVRPYRYPRHQKLEIEKLIHEMFNDGIIRHSTSPFSSPVLLVKKKDGS
ncbi:unnamed protein product [Rhodiola kirilowii]